MTLVGGNTARLRLLVTGSSGQLGRELLNTLPAIGDVIATDRDLARLGGFAPATQLDICNEAMVESVVRQVQPDVIINAACYKSIDGAELDPQAALRANAVGPGILASVARRHDAALVHFSSAYVFSGDGQEPWNENSPCAPVNMFGRSKLEGEQAIRYAGGRTLIVRTGCIYGEHSDNFVYETLHAGSYENTVRAVDNERGAPTPVSCLAETVATIIAAAAPERFANFSDIGGVLHVSCRGEATWKSLAEEIFRLATVNDVPLAVRHVEGIPRKSAKSDTPRPANARLDVTRLRTAFGIELPSWQDALAAVLPTMIDRFLAKRSA